MLALPAIKLCLGREKKLERLRAHLVERWKSVAVASLLENSPAERIGILQVMFLAVCEFAPERNHDDTWL